MDGWKRSVEAEIQKVGQPQPVVDREALLTLAAEWKQSADEDERYLNRAHASEIHDVMASIRINREHADAVLALLNGTATAGPVVLAETKPVADGLREFSERPKR
jgi:hypothetical protein